MPETTTALGDYEDLFLEALHEGLFKAGILVVPSSAELEIFQALRPVLDAYRWDIVGAQEAAALLGVSKSRFHELKARGDLPGGKQLADKVVYRGEDIRACAAQRKAT